MAEEEPPEAAPSELLKPESGESSKRGDELAEQPGDPPVVARMVIEIRSDGLRTIARGALEDRLNDDRVAIEARGETPIELAAKLTKTLLTMPLLARSMSKGLLVSSAPESRTRQVLKGLLDRGRGLRGRRARRGQSTKGDGKEGSD